MAPSERLRESASGWIAAGAIALGAMAMAGGGLLLAPIVALAGFAGLLAAPGRTAATLRNPAALALAAFIGWAALTSLWSPWESSDNVVKLVLGAPLYASLAALCARLSDRPRNIVRGAIAFAGVAAAVMFAVELIGGGALTAAHRPDGTPREILWLSLAHGVSPLVVLLPAVVAVMWPGGPWARAVAAGVVAMTVVGSFVFGISANALGLFCALIAAAFALRHPRMTVRVLGWTAAVSVLAAPVMGLAALAPASLRDVLPLSWEMRLEIWRFTSLKIFDAPLLGHGFDASRGIHDTVSVRGMVFEAIPLHPHNIGLHAWLETGALGAVAFAIALALGGEAISRAPQLTRRQAVAIAATAAGLGGMGLVSYGLWQEWWIAVAFLGAAACFAVGPSPAPRRV